MFSFISTRAARNGVAFFSRQRLHTMRTQEALRLVETKDVGVRAVARTDLARGTEICAWGPFKDTGSARPSPTMHTVMLDSTVHVAPTEGAEFINHACANTNTRIIIHEDSRGASFVVTEDVREGDALSFNYNTTEWDMNSPFTCQCPACVEKSFPTVVRGFKHLSLKDQGKISHEASPLILQRAAEEAYAFLKHVNGLQQDAASYYAPINEEEEEERVGAL